MYGIDYLISPVEFEHFRQHHFGKKALLIPGDKSKFSDLLGWDEINQLARYSPLGRNSAKLTMDKVQLPPEEIQNFNHWIKEGATFTINHLQTKDPVIDKFSRILSAQLNSSVNINCYVSTPGKQGFDNHYDRHDVFIIQVEGEKKWTVFKSTPGPHTYPLEIMKCDKSDPPDEEPYIECTMSPGDVLYIPRGHWHYAISETPCIHLTVGHQARPPALFLQWYLNELMWSDEFLRQDFPIAEAGEFAGRRTDDELKNHIRKFQDYFGGLIMSEQLEDKVHEYIMTNNRLSASPNAVFPDQQTIYQDITEDTLFCLPVGQKVTMKYDAEHDRAHVQVRGFKIELEGIKEHHLNAIFTGEVISGKSVLGLCPDVKWDDVKNTLLTLLDKGVLMLVGKD